MHPLKDWPLEQRRDIVGVFTDIDDTLTTDGAITPDALQALSELKQAGLHVIPITGRPVGWSEQFAATWPVDAIVPENGAVALLRVNRGNLPALYADSSLSKIYLQDASLRAHNYARMQAVAARVLREVPQAQVSHDSVGRETDIAIDHSEFSLLDEAAITQVVGIMQQEGMSATVSSIHINGWYGNHNKLAGAHWIVRELLGRDLRLEMDRWVYVGDSTNDQLMFEAFANSFGVANIRRFVPQLTFLPRYITASERGAGFAEIVRALLAHRTPT